jgi:hypothetical protein
MQGIRHRDPHLLANARVSNSVKGFSTTLTPVGEGVPISFARLKAISVERNFNIEKV